MSENKESDTVVAYTGTKEAALYFQNVIPVTSYQFESGLLDAYFSRATGDQLMQAFFSGVAGEIMAAAGTFNHLLPPSLRDDKVFLKLIAKVLIWVVLNNILKRFQEEVDKTGDQDAEGKITFLQEKFGALLKVNLGDEQSLDVSWDALLDQYGLAACPTIIPQSWADPSEVTDITSEITDFRVSLLNAKLVDPHRASWEQILAFREDTEAQRKLRRVRRFFTETYEGKDQQSIQDDLHQRLEDHEAAVRKFGFESKATVLEAILNSKALRRATGVAIPAALLGKREEALISLLAGAGVVLFDIGNAFLEVKRQQIEFNEMVASHPLGYVLDAKEELE